MESLWIIRLNLYTTLSIIIIEQLILCLISIVIHDFLLKVKESFFVHFQKLTPVPFIRTYTV
ncbi:MAG: hypothetical protein EBS89_09070 [Proteobacteria bacterium]|nr:hypothetical protein [Pseudomonadota bacterium]